MVAEGDVVDVVTKLATRMGKLRPISICGALARDVAGTAISQSRPGKSPHAVESSYNCTSSSTYHLAKLGGRRARLCLGVVVPRTCPAIRCALRISDTVKLFPRAVRRWLRPKPVEISNVR